MRKEIQNIVKHDSIFDAQKKHNSNAKIVLEKAKAQEKEQKQSGMRYVKSADGKTMILKKIQDEG